MIGHTFTHLTSTCVHSAVLGRRVILGIRGASNWMTAYQSVKRKVALFKTHCKRVMSRKNLGNKYLLDSCFFFWDHWSPFKNQLTSIKNSGQSNSTTSDCDYEATRQSETVSWLSVVTYSINSGSAGKPIPSLWPLTCLSILRSTPFPTTTTSTRPPLLPVSAALCTHFTGVILS